MYEYVRGGFPQKEMPVTGENSGMYQEFDSALRAASYNMFCSPLKPVNSPASFKAEQGAAAAFESKGRAGERLAGVSDARKFSGEEEPDEDPAEVRRRTEQKYKELDRLIQGDSRATSGGNSKLIKMRRKAGMIEKKAAPKAPPAPEKRQVPARSASDTSALAPPAETTKAGRRQSGGKSAMGRDGLAQDLAGQLQGLTGSGDASSEMFLDDEIESSNVEEGYEELQKLLGHKSFGGQKRKLDSARFTGNMTKYREAGMFKRVTLKDPLSRVYAQRLNKEPPPVSKGAIARPSRPGQGAPGEGEEDAHGDDAEGGAVTAESFVDEILGSMSADEAAPPRAATRARATMPRGGGAKPRKASTPQYSEFDALLGGGLPVTGAGDAGKQGPRGGGVGRKVAEGDSSSAEQFALGGNASSRLIPGGELAESVLK